jgi:hypothetical protein
MPQRRTAAEAAGLQLQHRQPADDVRIAGIPASMLRAAIASLLGEAMPSGGSTHGPGLRAEVLFARPTPAP